MKLLFTTLSVALSALAIAPANASRPCEEGETVTLARPFQYAASSGQIKTAEEGLVLMIERLDRIGGRALVDFAEREGTSVRALYDHRGKISGCSVDWRTRNRIRTCVGTMGYCSATFDPKKLVFSECSITP